MSLQTFLHELSQLIHHRSVISCVYPKLVALETVNELTGLNCAYPGLITTSGAAVREHLNQYRHPSLLFITEHLDDGLGLDLILELSDSAIDHLCILILTHNHDLSQKGLNDRTISAIVLEHNIGSTSCVLGEALRAVNRKERYVDPELNTKRESRSAYSDQLSERELEVLALVADGLSNPEIAAKLYVGSTTVRDHVQSLMRKLQAKSRTGAAVAGLRLGLLTT